MDKQNSLFNNAAFSIICLLVLFTPMARASVHLWAKTLIQIFALTGVILLTIETLIRKNQHSDKKKTAFPKSAFHILFSMVIISIGSAFFSNHPGLVIEAILMLLTYIAIYYMTIESVNTRKKQRTLVYVIVSTAVLLSIIGLLKRFEMTPFPFWEYKDIVWAGYTSLTGPYVNRNHMAGFLEMAIPVTMGLFLTRNRSIEKRLLMISVALLLIVTQVLTLSRGGWTATACSLIFLLSVLFFQKDFYHKRVLIAITAFSLVVMVLVLTSFPIVERIVTLTQQDPTDNIQGRLRIWSGTTALIQDHILTGTGPGTFVVAYPAYQTPGAAILSVYAHNDYLQFIADTGIFIVPVILWGLFFLFKSGFTKLKSQSRQTRGFALGAMTAVVAIAIHSLSDFNLHIPANIVLFVILAGTLSRQRVL